MQNLPVNPGNPQNVNLNPFNDIDIYIQIKYINVFLYIIIHYTL